MFVVLNVWKYYFFNLFFFLEKFFEIVLYVVYLKGKKLIIFKLFVIVEYFVLFVSVLFFNLKSELEYNICYFYVNEVVGFLVV